MNGELPPHYRTTIRRFLRFGVIGLALGMILGLAWTELGRSARYGEVNGQPQQVDPPEGRIELQLPPGYKWEAGLSFKLSHGHTILIAGLIPLCFAFTLVVLHQAGGKQISPGALNWAFWPYVVGASGALLILLYKGVVGFSAVRGGNFDLAAIEYYLGVMATPCYCTKIASKLIRTYTDRHGLKMLVEELLGENISKAQQSSDWGGPVLNDAQREYAASDVRYLHRMKEELDRRLEREGRTEMAQACFDFLPTRARLDVAGWADHDIFSHM